jgi:hypothetical protein
LEQAKEVLDMRSNKHIGIDLKISPKLTVLPEDETSMQKTKGRAPTAEHHKELKACTILQTHITSLY